MATEEGVYANGQVVVQPLPEAIFGPAAERTVPLRRLDAVLTEEQLQEHCEKELQKVHLGMHVHGSAHLQSTHHGVSNLQGMQQVASPAAQLTSYAELQQPKNCRYIKHFCSAAAVS